MEYTITKPFPKIITSDRGKFVKLIDEETYSFPNFRKDYLSCGKVLFIFTDINFQNHFVRKIVDIYSKEGFFVETNITIEKFKKPNILSGTIYENH